MGWPFLELLPQMSSDFLFQNQSKINEANKEFSDWLGGKLPILSLPCTVSWQACHYNPKNNVIEILSLLLTLTLIKLASRCSLSGGGVDCALTPYFMEKIPILTLILFPVC